MAVARTLEHMERTDYLSGRMWRGFRDHGPIATSGLTPHVSSANPNSSRACVSELLRAGWIEIADYETVRGNRTARYRACTEPLIVPDVARPNRTPKAGLAKRRLTAAVKKAEGARRTALVAPMSRALFELEKELREIRESL